jgi:hypothetical protein
MLATSGRHSLAGKQATAITKATTATPRAEEMPEAVVTPTTRVFFAEIREKLFRTAKFHEKILRKE